MGLRVHVRAMHVRRRGSDEVHALRPESHARRRHVPRMLKMQRRLVLLTRLPEEPLGRRTQEHLQGETRNLFQCLIFQSPFFSSSSATTLSASPSPHLPPPPFSFDLTLSPPKIRGHGTWFRSLDYPCFTQTSQFGQRCV